MNTYTLTPEERFDLILECRNSGLTDYQWCKQKGISTNTLYRWINRFRQNGYPDIPKAKGKSQIEPAKQDVVKLDIVADTPCETSGYSFCENNVQPGFPNNHTSLQESSNNYYCFGRASSGLTPRSRYSCSCFVRTFPCTGAFPGSR